MRDSACYVCWAFARAYAPSVLKPFVSLFTEAMLLASLFDREVRQFDTAECHVTNFADITNLLSF